MKKAFSFSKENLSKIKKALSAYPEDRKKSAIMPVLHIVQEQEGYISKEAISKVSEVLEISPAKILEIISFYGMFRTSPVGKYHVQVCGNISCMLKGGKQVVEACREVLEIEVGETTKDGMFSLVSVECMGCCTESPAIKINDRYFVLLDYEITKNLLLRLKKGETLASVAGEE